MLEVGGCGGLGQRLIMLKQREIGRVLLKVRLQPMRIQKLQPQLLRPRLFWQPACIALEHFGKTLYRVN